MPLWITQMYDALGIQWATTVFGAMALLCVPCVDRPAKQLTLAACHSCSGATAIVCEEPARSHPASISRSATRSCTAPSPVSKQRPSFRPVVLSLGPLPLRLYTTLHAPLQRSDETPARLGLEEASQLPCQCDREIASTHIEDLECAGGHQEHCADQRPSAVATNALACATPHHLTRSLVDSAAATSAEHGERRRTVTV